MRVLGAHPVTHAIGSSMSNAFIDF